MRNRLVSAALGIVGLIALGAPVAAAPEHGRVAEIAFGQCLEIIADMASELGEEPVELVRTGDRRSVRFDASDGSVTLTCDRLDNRLTLTRAEDPALARTAGLR